MRVASTSYIGVAMIYNLVLVSRLPMLMQLKLKLVLYAKCTPIFPFQACLNFFNFQIGSYNPVQLGPPLITPMPSCGFYTLLDLFT